MMLCVCTTKMMCGTAVTAEASPHRQHQPHGNHQRTVLNLLTKTDTENHVSSSINMLKILTTFSLILANVVNVVNAEKPLVPIKTENVLSIEQIDALRLSWEENCLIPSAGPESQRTLHPDCVVYFFHLHKTGGTTMCNTAKENHFRVTGHNNCNTPIPVSLSNERDPSLGIAQQFIFEHHLSFVGQEYRLFLPNITSDKFVHLVTVRHPVDRLISHLHHTLCENTYEHALQFIKNQNCSTIKDVKTATLSDWIIDPCFQKAAPGMAGITTDFYVDMFVKCYHRNCTEADLALALQKLHYFSVIMITDTPEEYDRCYTKITLFLCCN